MKKDSIIGCLIIFAVFLFLILSGIGWQLTLIGTLALILYAWAYSKWEAQLAKKIADEVKKKDEEQFTERVTTELEKLQQEKDNNQK